MNKLLIFFLPFILFSCTHENDTVIESLTTPNTRSAIGFSVNYIGDGKVIEITWHSAYKVKQIKICDKYNLYTRTIPPYIFDNNTSGTITLGSPGSYRIDIDYIDEWLSDSSIQHQTLYYNYTDHNNSGIVNDSWEPKCRHDFNVESYALLKREADSFKLTSYCYGEYTLIVCELDNMINIINKEDITHLGPLREHITMIRLPNNGLYEARIYVKDCPLGIYQCTDYKKLFINSNVGNYEETFYWN